MNEAEVVRKSIRGRPAAALAAAVLAGASVGCGGQPAVGPRPHPAISQLTRAHDYPLDPAYMGFGTEDITALPASARERLLDAPFLPFDGLNEHGLSMALLAVPEARAPSVAGQPTVGPLLMIRLVLDRSRTVAEALSLLGRTNLEVGDPPVHFFLADATGRAAIVEYVAGAIEVTTNDRPWLAVTNFVMAGTRPEARPSLCPRYRTATESLTGCQGRMAVPEALRLLSAVSQANTMWSVVYDLSLGAVTVAVGRDFSRPVVRGLTATWPAGPAGRIGLTGPAPGA